MNKLGPDDSDRRVRNDFEKLRADFKYMQSQNIDLRRQINEIQNILKDKIKQSEIWKTMYDRAVMYFPTNEINALKHSFEIEKLNLIQGDQENETNNNKSKINTLISKLNEENLGLKMQLERVKSSVKQEMEHLSKFQSENKKIKNEFHSMKEFYMNELKSKEVEIENLRVKLKHEETQRDELKKKHANELNAAQIRYENELTIQNDLMQKKSNSLVKEINQLNDFVRKLQQEKHSLTTNKLHIDETQTNQENTTKKKRDKLSIITQSQSHQTQTQTNTAQSRSK